MSPIAGTLNERRLTALLDDDDFVRELHVLERVGSTNDEVRALAREGAPSGTVVVADAQNAGRGRLGRTWWSPPGVGVYLSVLIRPERPAAEVTRWVLASSLAACEACREVGGCDVTIKWPNDLVHRGRKVAGTLAELRSTGASLEELVIGTGFNANHTPADFAPELADRATSLRLAREGREVDRERLAAAYLARLGRRVNALQQGVWDGIRDEWTRLAPHAMGTAVRVRASGSGGPGTNLEGVTRGVDDAGALLVEYLDGRVVSVHLGEVVTPVEP